MKKFTFFVKLVIIGIVSYSSNALAQGRFNLRVVPQSIDCANNKVSACVEIKSTSADSNFVMGNANLRLFYNSKQLTTPTVLSRDNFSSGNYMTIGAVVGAGIDTSLITLNIVYRGENGEGTMVTTDWKRVACIEFTINPVNLTKCHDLFFLPKGFSLSWPNNVVTRAFASPTLDDPTRTLTAEVTQGVFTSIVNQCPVNPIVALTGGGTINPGGTANLTITVQNNILPATVILTGGITIQLTQQEPAKTIQVSPNITTTYQVLSVTGACGAGSAAAGQSEAVVTVIPTQNCPPLKCIPLAVRIVK